ncbi:hypothetical protein FXO37_20804 [Capsicum annuum]|nr:hypothetical protein FXO37_20804 [Capsicum annuum]
MFTRIVTCGTTKEAWDKLKEEFKGSNKVKSIKVLTLKREFELLKMKDSDTVTIRSEGIVKDAFQVRHKFKQQKKGKKVFSDHSREVKSGGYQGESSRKGIFPPCGICKKTNHLEKNHWQKSKRSDRTKVKLGDGALVQTQGRGSVKFPMDEDAKRGKLDNKAELWIFLGYSTTTKGYIVYNDSTKKVLISRDLVVDESSHYDWDRDIIVKNQEGSTSVATLNPQTSFLSAPRRDSDPLSCQGLTSSSTRSLAEVYDQCNFALMEPSSFEEVTSHEAWISSMGEKLAMINKNDTSGLVDRPSLNQIRRLVPKKYPCVMELLKKDLLLINCSNIKELKDLEISEVLKGSIEKLPYSISKLTCLNHLELPKMKDGENEDENGTCHPEELLHCPWRISSWPLEEVSSSRIPDIFVDKFQVLLLLKNNPTIGKSFHFLVHPIEEETDIGVKKLQQSLEIHRFSDYPCGLERLAAQAEFLFLIDNQFIKSLSSLGAESTRKIKFCWIEGCSKMESILSREEVSDYLGNSKEIIEVTTGVGHRLEILRVSHAVCLKNMCSGNLQGHGLRFLKCLCLEHCPKLANSSSSYCLNNLQILQIKFCDKFRTLFEDEQPQPLLPKLHRLCLWVLPNLESIACIAKSLQTLIVGECPKLESVNLITLLSKKLEILQMSSCDNLREIVTVSDFPLP